MCKTVPIETLVSRINKKIRRESVVSESEFWSTILALLVMLTEHQLRKRPAIPT